MRKSDTLDSFPGGIIHWTEHLTDFENGTHFEFVVNANRDVLHINSGAISKDVFPNQLLDTEDTIRNGIRNGWISHDEDISLDGIANSDPHAMAAGGEFWDRNGDGQKDDNEPSSHDDWSYHPTSARETIDCRHINGTEGNLQDIRGCKPDTEDINHNGILVLGNHYWAYRINLSHEHEDCAKCVVYKAIDEEASQDDGWRWNKIPLTDHTSIIGSPSVDTVEYVRLWLTDTSPTFVSLYSMVFTREN